MEELKKLEQLHSMIMLIQSQTPLSNSDAHSQRFLANFLNFLMEPCGQLCFDDKCRLISQQLSLISTPSLVEQLQPPPSRTNEEQPTVKDNAGLAMVGLDAMQRANSTLEDFCRSYFMFHGMDAENPKSLFTYLPLLSFTESYIYQLDSLNEKMVNVCKSTTAPSEGSAEEDDSTSPLLLLKTFNSRPFQPLTLLLEHHGLLTDRIVEELRQGEEYWSLERKLCSALEQQVEILVEDVMRAIHLKSFDYRVLNLLLYQLRGEKVNDLHMEFLSVSEFLVEISDDLFDYEEDVLENNFNILRMFVRIYGASGAPVFLAKCIAEAEEKYQGLLKALGSGLSLSYQRRCEEATREGGKISGHPLGSWTIPPLIVDEKLYRSNLQNSL